MTVLRHLGKREWLLSTLAIITIICQVFLDLRLIDYMQTITEMIVEPDASVSGVLTEGGKNAGVCGRFYGGSHYHRLLHGHDWCHRCP